MAQNWSAVRDKNQNFFDSNRSIKYLNNTSFDKAD